MNFPKITITKVDILSLDVDAIVNSANPSLLAGSGLCGAIHKAAGRELERECIHLGKCEKGSSVITDGYNLKANKVIHAVGPHYILDNDQAPDLLEKCYLSIFRLANQQSVNTVAIPSISTNIYQYPLEEATIITFGALKKFLTEENSIILGHIIFALSSNEAVEIYNKIFEQAVKEMLINNGRPVK